MKSYLTLNPVQRHQIPTPQPMEGKPGAKPILSSSLRKRNPRWSSEPVPVRKLHLQSAAKKTKIGSALVAEFLLDNLVVTRKGSKCPPTCLRSASSHLWFSHLSHDCAIAEASRRSDPPPPLPHTVLFMIYGHHVYYSILQYITVYYSTLQYTIVYYSTLQCPIVY